MQRIVWCLALTLLSTVSTNEDLDHQFSGCWHNQLSSFLNIVVHIDGGITGSYQSSVSETGLQANGSLCGYHQGPQHPTFGFVVKWTSPNTKDSISVWTGQFFKGPEGEILETVWLFRSSVDKERNNWDATKVGQDYFFRYVGTCPV
ncbi:avidin-related protein 4/5-like [Carcharodon carcharias]|uniref:avidin-related protein 4/5-like n=1 Tax=Carcharodon carcharias TaxID=13397 RepID=UPI001B7E0DA6|nr:avidin-related protein 4/5-like [Carcharodon carcharias]